MLDLPDITFAQELCRTRWFVFWRGQSASLSRSVIVKECIADDVQTALARIRHIQALYDVIPYGLHPPFLQGPCWHHKRCFAVLADPGGMPVTMLTDGPLDVQDALLVFSKVVQALASCHEVGLALHAIFADGLLYDSETHHVCMLCMGHLTGGVIRDPYSPELTDCIHLQYQSPEASGRQNRDCGCASDLYAAGVLLFHLLTGRLPFEDRIGHELVAAHLSQAVNISFLESVNCPAPLQVMCVRLLKKYADDRYASARDLLADLRVLQSAIDREESLIELQLTATAKKPVGWPQRFVGRAEEVTTLHQSWRRMIAGHPECVLVRGAEGTGKTALIRELIRPLTTENGIFLYGCCDEMATEQPFVCLTQALEMLAYYRLEASPQLQMVLKNHGRLLVQIAPGLRNWLAENDLEEGSSSVSTDFSLVWKDIFTALGRLDRPVLIFLDDLQWADAPSVRVLKRWLLESQSCKVMIVGSVSHDMMREDAPFARWQEDFQAGMPVGRVELQPFSENEIAELVGRTFGMAVADVGEIVPVLREQSGGNCLRLRFILESFLDREDGSGNDKMAEFSRLVHGENQPAPDDYLARWLGVFDEETERVLRIAALLGPQCSLHMLAAACENTISNLLKPLQMVLRKGLITLPNMDDWWLIPGGSEEQLGNIHLQFRWPCIRRFFYEQINASERSALYLKLASLIDVSVGESQLVPLRIAHFFLRGVNAVKDSIEQVLQADRHGEMANFAESLGAYEVAVAHCRAGLSLINDHPQVGHLNLLGRLLDTMLRCMVSLGCHEESLSLIRQQLAYERDPNRRARLFLKQATVVTDQQASHKAIRDALAALELKVDLLKAAETVDELQKFVESLELPLGDEQQSALRQKAECTDAVIVGKIELLVDGAYQLRLRGGDLRLAWAAGTQALALCMEHGASPSCPLALQIAGHYFAQHASQVGLANRLGQLGVQLLTSHDQKLNSRVRLLHAFDLLHFGRPIRDAILLYKSALDHLDPEDAQLENICRQHLTLGALLAGVSLKQALRHGSSSLDEAVVALMAEEKHLTSFPDVDPAIVGLRPWSVPLKMLVLLIESKPREAMALGFDEMPNQNRLYGNWYGCLFETYLVMAIYLAGETSSHEGILGDLKQSITARAAVSPINFEDQRMLVELARALAEGHFAAAMALADDIARRVAEQGFVHHQCLALRLVGTFARESGLRRAAAVYLRDAHDAARLWGLAIQDVRSSESAGLHDESTGIDALMYAVQAISREIHVDEFYTQMISKVAELSGGERAFLIADKNGELAIQAMIDGDTDMLSLPLPVVGCGLLAESIVRFVSRNGTPLILDNAQEDPDFCNHPYIRDKGICALLCTPLWHGERMLGVVYLESPDPSAFSAERVNLLNLLLSQAAICLENAELYRSSVGQSEALRESERRLSTVMAISPVGILRFDVDGKLVWQNDYSTSLIGEADDWLKRVHPDHRERVVATWKHCMKKRLVFRDEIAFTHESGQVIWVLAQGKPEVDGKGHHFGYVGAITDITATKEAQEQLVFRRRFERMLARISNRLLEMGSQHLHDVLQQSLAELHELLGTDLGMIFSLAPDNETFEQLTCVGRIEGVRLKFIKNYSSYKRQDFPWWNHRITRNQVVHVPSLASIPESGHALKKALEELGMKSLLSLPMWSQGKLTGVLGFGCMSGELAFNSEDISALKVVAETFSGAISRKEAEDKIREQDTYNRMLFTQTPLGLVLSNLRTGKLYDVNPAYASIVGYSVEELRSMTFLELTAPEYREEDLLRISRLRSDQTYGPYIKEYIHKDGHHVHVRLRGMLMEIGGETYIWSCVEDITGQMQMEEQLRQSQKMESIGRLAGGVAHDFNNMLAGISGAAELLHSRIGDDEKLAHYVRSIQQAASRAADLTSKLLAFSRKGKLLSQNVDVHRMILDALDLMERSIDKRVEVKTELCAPEFHVLGDAAQLQNIILNLAVNARDAMPDGGMLTIRTENMQCLVPKVPLSMTDTHVYVQEDLFSEHLERDCICIFVSDNGSGIAPEVMGHIFEPFFTTKEVGKGTGLGLAAVYGTVCEHHGTIRAESEPEKGSTFIISLPLIEKGRQAMAIPVRQPVISPPTEGGCILLVDDEDIIREMGRTILEDLGYEVLTANNGLEAIARYKQNPGLFAVVILDMVMPQLSGRDTMLQILDVNPKATIVICSGYSAESSQEELLKLGAAAFLAKPYRVAALQATLQQVLQK